MATTTPDNILTPDAGDQYALVQDLGLMADSVQDALTRRGNALKGTAAQRVSALASTTAGVLWQDTDGIGMIWKRGTSAWVPAVWRWAGTTAQMNAFTQAPNGFEWFDTSNNRSYTRESGVWTGYSSGTLPVTFGSGTITWKKYNGIAEVRWAGSGSFPTGYTALSSSTLPPDVRPSNGSVRGSGALNAMADVGLTVTDSGGVGIINSTGGARTGGEGIAVYFSQ